MPVHIAVTVKEVQDPTVSRNDLIVDESGRHVLSRSTRARIMNGYDENAVEMAVRLRERYGGMVTALTYGPPTAVETLRRALAMGCDDAIHVLREEADDDQSTAATILAAVLRKLPTVELVLSGRQASDTDGGSTFIGMAAILGWPAVTPAVDVSIDAGSVMVKRLTEDGSEHLSMRSPAVIGVSSEGNAPRYPPLQMLFKAARAKIPSWTTATLGLDGLEPRVRIRRVWLNARTSAVEIIDGSCAADKGRRLAERLWKAGLL